MIIIYDYLIIETLPKSKIETTKILRLASSYHIISKELYNLGYSTLYLWYMPIRNRKGTKRSSRRGLIHSAKGTQFRLLLMHKLLKVVEEGLKIIVAVEYFTKWIVAKVLTSTTIFQIIKFFKVNIFLRYGLRRFLFSNTEPQLCRKRLKLLLKNITSNILSHWYITWK